MDRSLVIGGAIAAVLVVAMIAIAGSDAPDTVQSKSGVEVNAPGAAVKTDDDKVQVKAPFVDVEVPKSKSND